MTAQESQLPRRRGANGNGFSDSMRWSWNKRRRMLCRCRRTGRAWGKPEVVRARLGTSRQNLGKRVDGSATLKSYGHLATAVPALASVGHTDAPSGRRQDGPP
jgi:hypothetical protein